jgi:hypothetical protein
MGVVLQRGFRSAVQHVPSHPEVNQESATSLEPDNQILAAAIDRHDPLALQLSRDLDGVERARQARVGDVDALEAPPDQAGLESAPDGLDFRELGHRPSVVGSLRLDAADALVSASA